MALPLLEDQYGNILSRSIFASDNALGSGIVVSGVIANGAVVSGSIASGAVGTTAIASGSITSGLLASGLIASITGGASLTSGEVTSGFIGNGAVVSGSIASGVIPSAINLAALPSGQIIAAVSGAPVYFGSPDVLHDGNADFVYTPTASGRYMTVDTTTSPLVITNASGYQTWLQNINDGYGSFTITTNSGGGFGLMQFRPGGAEWQLTAYDFVDAGGAVSIGNSVGNYMEFAQGYSLRWNSANNVYSHVHDLGIARQTSGTLAITGGDAGTYATIGCSGIGLYSQSGTVPTSEIVDTGNGLLIQSSGITKIVNTPTGAGLAADQYACYTVGTSTLYDNGNNAWYIGSDYVRYRSDYELNWCPATNIFVTPDTGFARYASGVVSVTDANGDVAMTLGGSGLTLGPNYGTQTSQIVDDGTELLIVSSGNIVIQTPTNTITTLSGAWLTITPGAITSGDRQTSGGGTLSLLGGAGLGCPGSVPGDNPGGGLVYVFGGSGGPAIAAQSGSATPGLDAGEGGQVYIQGGQGGQSTQSHYAGGGGNLYIAGGPAGALASGTSSTYAAYAGDLHLDGGFPASGGLTVPGFLGDVSAAGNIWIGTIAASLIEIGTVSDVAITIGGSTATVDIVGSLTLPAQSITSGFYASGSIASGMLASGLLAGISAGASLTSGQVTSGFIGNNAVNTNNIASGAITSGLLASGLIAGITSSLGSGLVSGEVTSGFLGNNAVNTNNIASGAITSGLLASGLIANLAGALTSGEVTSGFLGNNAVTSGNIASGSIGQFALASGAVNSGQVGSGAIQGQAASGAFNIASGTIWTLDIASGAIQSGLLGVNSVNATNINNGAVNASKLGSGAVASGKVSSGVIQGQAGTGPFMIASGTISTFDLASGSITSGLLASGLLLAITGSDSLTSGQVTSGFIGNASVTSGNIASGSISTFTMASGAKVDSAEWLIDDTFVTAEAISGMAVALTQSGTLQTAMAGVSGRMPCVGILSVNNAASGASVTMYRNGRLFTSNVNFSGWPGSPIYVGQSGGVIASGALNTSGYIYQVVGTSISASGMMIQIGDTFLAGNLTSGQIVSGNIGNAAVTSGNISSGAVGQYQLSPVAVNSGQVGSGAITGQAGGFFNIASGTINTYDMASGATAARSIFTGPFISGTSWTAVTLQNISGVCAVSLSQSGIIQIAKASISGTMPAIGIVVDNVASGINANVYTAGAFQLPVNSGQMSYSGYIGLPVYVGRSGQIVTTSGGINSGGFASGDAIQFIGVVWNSGGIITEIGGIATSGLASGSVTQFILASGSVGSGNIASGSIGRFALASGSVASGNIASGSIGRFAHASGAVNSGHIGSGAITGQAGGGAFNIASGTISTNDLASGAVNSFTMASGATLRNIARLSPISVYPGDSLGRTFPNYYTGSGGNGAFVEEGLGVAGSISGNVTWQLRFALPNPLPLGTAKIELLSIAAATSGTAFIQVNDGCVLPAGGDPSAAPLFAETVATVIWSGVGGTANENVINATISSGGAGYVVGDVIMASGGTSTQNMLFYVNAINSSGSITSGNIVQQGVYSTNPASPTIFSSGHGVNAALALSFNSGGDYDKYKQAKITLTTPMVAGGIVPVALTFLTSGWTQVNTTTWKPYLIFE